MLIAAAVRKNSIHAVIPETLDEAPGILIFDPDNLSDTACRQYVTENFAQAMIDADCEALLCGPIHSQALFNAIADACITRYHAASMIIPHAVDAMNGYRLEQIQAPVGGSGCAGHDHDHDESECHCEDHH